MKLFFSVLLPVLLFSGLTLPADAADIRLDFTDGLKGWDEKIFDGRTAYRVIESSGRKVLAAESQGNASALIYWKDIDPQKFPRLRWRWKIERILKKGRVGTKPGDDYPARIYIVFDSWLPNYARSINYIWASHAEPNQVYVSPYYRRSMMLVVEAGSVRAGEWVVEERDLLADYQRVFGGKMPKIKAVAIMTDGDNTGESVQAWYDWIEFVAERK